jgi:hypothetical protein
MGRLRRPTSGEGSEDDAGLAGWLYTDLLLGLAVVFLAGTTILVPKLLEDADAPSTPTSSTTSTSTTTTLPVKLCTSLYAVDGADRKEDGIWIVVNRGLDVNEIADQFEQRLAQELAAENPSLEKQGKVPFELSSIKVGLTIVYGGYPSDRDPNWAVGEAQGAYAKIRTSRLSYLFAEDSEFPETIARVVGTRSVGANEVGFDLYPYIKSPC